MKSHVTESETLNERLSSLRQNFQSLPEEKKSELVKEFPLPEDQMIVGWSIWNFTKFDKKH